MKIKSVKQMKSLLISATEDNPLVTPADAMNEGTHHWWTKNGLVHCCGAGPGWYSQSDEVINANDIDYYANYLYKNYRKKIWQLY